MTIKKAHKAFIVGLDASFTDSQTFTRQLPYKGDRTVDGGVGLSGPQGEPFEGMSLEQGLNSRTTAEFAKWLELALSHIVIRRRYELESDPTVRQLLPYTVVMQLPKHSTALDTSEALIINYKRLPAGDEVKLVDNWSIGGGGHVDSTDVIYHPGTSEIDLPATIIASNQRECDEEYKFFDASGQRVDLRDPSTAQYVIMHVGFIRDDSNEVGQVHLALVNILAIPHDWRVETNEPDKIAVGEPATAAVLLSKGLKFENWSQILLEEFAGVGKLVKGPLPEDQSPEAAELGRVGLSMAENVEGDENDFVVGSSTIGEAVIGLLPNAVDLSDPNIPQCRPDDSVGEATGGLVKEALSGDDAGGYPDGVADDWKTSR